MAKRNSARNVVELISHFPWWAGVTAAFVGFVLLRWIAGLEVPVPSDPEQAGSLLWRHLIKAFAIGGQWIFPALLLTGAVLLP